MTGSYASWPAAVRKAYMRRYYLKNREAFRRRGRKWYARVKAAVLAKLRRKAA